MTTSKVVKEFKRGEVIPVNAKWLESKSYQVEVGFDPSVPMGMGAEYAWVTYDTYEVEVRDE